MQTKTLKRRTFLAAGSWGVAGAAVAAPAIATGKRTLKLVTTWPKNFPGLGTGAQRFADRVTSASDSRITIQLYAAGELVKPFEAFDAVSSGTADMYHGAEYYWVNKNRGFAFFTAVPMGLMANEMNAWIYYGGGQSLWDQLAAKFNIKGLPCGNTGVQMGGWFNKLIRNLDDLKGLKMRIPGLGGEVMNRLGASAVALPGGEIFPALQSGAIDATEWVGPWNDLAFGFYKVAKYYYYPGFHEPTAMLSLGINKDVWESFSETDQQIVRDAAAAENDYMYAEFTAKNSDALDMLVNRHNVRLERFSRTLYRAFAETSETVLKEVGAMGEMESKIYRNFIEFREKALRWTALSDLGYARARATAFKALLD